VSQSTGDVDTLLTESRLAGKHPDPALLEKIKALGATVVPSLIAMALDEQYYEADSESPDVRTAHLGRNGPFLERPRGYLYRHRSARCRSADGGAACAPVVRL
jgi:hypothetical protein